MDHPDRIDPDEEVPDAIVDLRGERSGLPGRRSAGCRTPRAPSDDETPTIKKIMAELAQGDQGAAEAWSRPS